MALWVMCASLGVWVGCTPKDSNPIVAMVGETAITAQDVRDFIDGLPAEAKGAESPDRAREHLQTLIDTELLLMEARAERIDGSPAFLRRMGRARKARLVRVFEERSITITVGDAELVAYIEELGHNRAIRPADIMVPDLETAARVLKEIHQGADFAEVARRWSANKETGPRGGDMGRFATRYEMITVLADQLFTLPAGALSEPIPVGKGYSIFKILDETTFELTDEQRNQAAEGLRLRKQQVARDSLVTILRQEFRLEQDPQGVANFATALRRGAEAASEEPLDLILYRYEGGQIKAADVVEATKMYKGDVLGSLEQTEQLAAFVEQAVLPDLMLMEAAIRDGIDREAEIVGWLEDLERQMLLTGLRGRVLQQTGQVTDADVRQYYDENPDRFLHPEQIDVQEVLVESESEALRLRQRIEEEGADLGSLARDHSLRSLEVRDEEGKFHVHQYESPQFGGFVEAVLKAQIDDLTGPVEVADGYSVFRVLSRGRRRETFEEAGLRARSQLKRATQRQAFNEFLQELRERHDLEVKVREDDFESAFGES